ncbi:MAG: cytochrome c [Geminicoccaceae bacterium]|nr:cytochrome c [Geminicoccaceae bacterium]
MKFRTLALAAVVFAITVPTGSGAQEATGIVAYRETAMKALGAHSGALKSILTDQTQLMDQVGIHARAIADIAAAIPAMFPEDSLDPPTEALPSIWEDPDGFQAAADRLAKLAGDLDAAAGSGDAQASLAAFAAMGKDGCGGCHADYRKKN